MAHGLVFFDFNQLCIPNQSFEYIVVCLRQLAEFLYANGKESAYSLKFLSRKLLRAL